MNWNIGLMTAVIVCSVFYAHSEELTAMDIEGTPFERLAESIAPRNIQVLIEKEATEVLLEVKGSCYLFNPHDGSRIASSLLGKRFMIRALENGLKWGEEFPGIHQIYIQPKSPDTAIFINGIQYAGGVAIYGINGTINIVNDLDIESYVKSILTTQFPAPAEPEVLSALAILTRTDAYYQAMKNQSSFWHVDASSRNFSGNALVVSNSPVDRAVETTRHLILVHSEEGKNAPFPTAWTEHSAGKTASYETIFRKEATAPVKGVEAPHAALARQESKWTYLIAKKTLANLLEIPQVKSVEVFLDTPSGKVYGLRIKDQSQTHDIDFLTLQNALGASHILSSDFTISLKEDAVLFTGFGKGHGAGLCLYSATAMAQNGENAVKILSKFFPETYLYNLDALPKIH
ncbi:MAG: SpoIID/LytB domain-containing protein [Chlamydiia bacterium]|nr:SpoIID/LytB domain-containing protein [Chlamydiia bacterium]